MIGPAVIAIALIVDVLITGQVYRHFNKKMLIGFMLGLACYFLPFICSWLLGSDQSGLFKVYKENFVRYFQPFDHHTPFYLYFLYLPIYMAPWSLFLIPSLWRVQDRWRKFSLNEKWLGITIILLFVFFTTSGSRRPYYILPMLPFTTIFVANWILHHQPTKFLTKYLIKLSWFCLALFFLFILPIFYSMGGPTALQKIF